LALPISREHDAKWISSSISATRQMPLKRCFYELVEGFAGIGDADALGILCLQRRSPLCDNPPEYAGTPRREPSPRPPSPGRSLCRRAPGMPLTVGYDRRLSLPHPKYGGSMSKQEWVSLNGTPDGSFLDP
jgi:hypothetical protein